MSAASWLAKDPAGPSHVGRTRPHGRTECTAGLAALAGFCCTAAAGSKWECGGSRTTRPFGDLLAVLLNAIHYGMAGCPRPEECVLPVAEDEPHREARTRRRRETASAKAAAGEHIAGAGMVCGATVLPHPMMPTVGGLPR
jgi:hypothetical protein